MNIHYKVIFSALFLCLNFLLLQAQNTENWQDGAKSQTPGKAILKGKIVDATTKSPLEYATLTLFSQRDSAMVTGGVTDMGGNFQIETVTGKYFAKIEFISYEMKIISDITIPKGNKMLNLGTLEMSTSAEMLDLVEVRAEKSQMQMTLDKRVFNVGKDLANRGGTADDLLDNIPSIAVDVEGNVSLRGNENVRILINGKPSGLLGIGDNNGLRQFPTSMIDRVEVITNPSARYEAEGVAGIINIILKKESSKGLNGSFDLTVGYPEAYGAGFNLNYRTKNLNLFGGYGLNYGLRNGKGDYVQELYRSDSIFILDQQREHERGGLSNSFRFGSDYFINPKNTITAALTYKVSDQDNSADIEYNDYLNDYPGNFLGVTYRTDDEKEEETSLEYSLNYKKTFNKKDQVLVFNIRYEDDIETEDNDYTEAFFNSNNQPTGKPNLEQRSINKEKNKDWRIQLDYVHPFSEEGKFEVGLNSSIRKIDNNYVVEQLNDVSWDTLPGLSNNFLYDENIHAAYLTFGNKHGNFSYLAGLRAEYSDVTTELVQSNEINPRDYFDLFPSLHLTYDLPQQNAVQVSYSRRIKRPGFWSLNPFFTFSDSRNLFTGNPKLDPIYTHSVEIGHIKYWDKATLSSSLYYRYSEGVTERIKTLNADGTTITRPYNLATEDAYGLEATISYSPLKWWKLDGDLNFYRSIVDGSNQAENLGSDNFSWFGRMSSKVTVLKGTDIQLKFNYRASTQTAQGSRKSIYFFDLGVSKDVLKNKGTLTLSVRDLFNSRKRRYTTFGDNFRTEGEFQWRSRIIKLTLNYRLNQKKNRGGGQRGGREGGGDEGGF